ncbi:MAG: 1,4-dihydroxy-2-naphthoate octaprenyltransferase [Planctomycetota bacterium]|nr:1,4-dihydroxy-2-naphthoate octaprenyltransferase [Planctomycetota bacterium]MCX8039520.1 1,4-dihydroxy-2-naphthoate octaprenyltransferase [Planctomycetota bacterium]MDW8373040.1 1,4-dihydroxy-2-naphthoate octaprenyltransferase [Planctomycetota bacterium]
MWRVWIDAARPKTLPAALAPVAVGSALAADAGCWRWELALGCLAGALCLQIACNYANDAGDAERGADGPDRVGPARAVASGLVSARAMLSASVVMAGAASLVGGWLALESGWPVLAIGGAALLAAFAYTLGPWPLAYRGLGDPFVLLFFGFAAVLGSAWVQVQQWPLPLSWWWAAAAVGLQATALIAINNIRDLASDARVGKRTLAVRLGAQGSRLYHTALHLAAAGSWSLAELWLPALITAVLGGLLSGAVWRTEGRALNRCLAFAAALLLLAALAAIAQLLLAP